MSLKGIHDKIIFNLELILERSKFLSNLYTKFFTKMTLEEFSMAGIDPLKNANVLVIGCGPVPHTLIILGKNTRWNIKGIDKDINAVERARNMIRENNLEDRVRVENEEGLNVDLKEYELIVIAYGVEPKEKVLERVLNEKPSNAKVIYRTTWEIFDIIYGKENLPRGAFVKSLYYRPDFVKSLLVTGEEQ